MKARHEFGTPEQWYDYLRTYFASQALSGTISIASGEESFAEFAEFSVKAADALLRELKK